MRTPCRRQERGFIQSIAIEQNIGRSLEAKPGLALQLLARHGQMAGDGLHSASRIGMQCLQGGEQASFETFRAGDAPVSLAAILSDHRSCAAARRIRRRCLIRLAICASSSSRRKGLVTYRSASAARPRLREASSAKAVNRITPTWSVIGSDLSADSTLKPSPSGSMTSQMTRSGTLALALVRPLATVAASQTR